MKEDGAKKLAPASLSTLEAWPAPRSHVEMTPGIAEQRLFSTTPGLSAMLQNEWHVGTLALVSLQ